MIKWVGCQRQCGSRVMLATNQDHERAQYLMHNRGLRDHADGIYHSAALGVAKPELMFFNEIATRERRDASQLILIDVTAANVDAARQAGWRAIHYTGQSPDQLTSSIVNGD
jgi:putative hydrolase of the HAD superfamily